MTNCDNQSFYKYFKENMDAMGLPSPDSLFSTIGTAVGTAATILKSIDALGKTATVGEMIGATTGLEALGVVAALSAAYYAGAIIGSIAVATGRYLSCGSTIADVISSAQSNHIYRPWLDSVLVHWPGIANPQHPGRIHYQYMMKVT